MGEEQTPIHSSIHPQEAGRTGSHSLPWLPRGRATALGGGATELMGDVIIFLLSERQTGRHTGRKSVR